MEIRKIDFATVKAFEDSMTSKINTKSLHLRTLRAIINRARKEHFITPPYPFKDYKIRTAKAQKLAIDPKYIYQIRNLELPRYSRLNLSRDGFLFSFYAMGMDFADIAFLRYSHISEGRIQYSRFKVKTGAFPIFSGQSLLFHSYGISVICEFQVPGFTSGPTKISGLRPFIKSCYPETLMPLFFIKWRLV